MADVSKLKQKPARRLGPPPAVDEASENLSAPEVAPVAPAPIAVVAAPQAAAPRRRDGRSMRRTGRTVTFATRVSQEFDDRIRDIAEEKGLMLVEVLERALEAYERELSA
jgi:hypothetical protein